MTKTPDQKKALSFLNGPYKWVLLHGGSRSGKTFIIVRQIIIRALESSGSRHVIFRLRFNHIKQSIFMETLPELFKKDPQLAQIRDKVVWNRSDYFITLPNGSEIWIGGLDDKERTEKVLGKEYATIYFNESSQIPYSSVTIAQTRLAQNVPKITNKFYFDCNPPTKSHWLYSLFFLGIDPETKTALARPDLYAEQRMNPDGNRANLPSDYIETVLNALPERKRKRFRDGEWLEDVEGALWKREVIDAARVVRIPSDLTYVDVSVDPAVTAKPGSNSTGIIVTAVDSRGHYYVLADRTQERASPKIWGTAAVTAYNEFAADAMIGEVNNGGDLVERNIKVIDSRINFRAVHATRGKILRAEPIAALYEKGIVHHVGEFPELEEQMCSFAPQLADQSSPDRCLVAGTLIDTSQGEIPIEDIRVGMYVLTRKGYKKVIAAGMTAENSPLTTLTLSNGKTLTGTPNHHIHTLHRGFICMDALVWNDILWTEKPSSITDARMHDIPIPQNQAMPDIFTRLILQIKMVVKRFINKFGLTSMERSQKDAIFTTKMEISQIILLKISNVFREISTWFSITTGYALRLNESILMKFDLSQRNGMVPTMATTGMSSMEKSVGPTDNLNITKPVKNAEKSSKPSLKTLGSVQENVLIKIPRKTGTILKYAYVWFVGKISKSSDQNPNKPVPVYVVRKCAAGTGSVYNLTVEGAHEFFANGVLVHNCDALVWGITDLIEKAKPGIKIPLSMLSGGTYGRPDCDNKFYGRDRSEFGL